MKYILFFCLLLFSCTNSFPQNPPKEKLVNWKLAGNKSFVGSFTNIINFRAKGGIADGTTANDKLIRTLLDSLQGKEAEIYFPNGKYLFTESIKIAGNITLRGQSADSTQLLFNLTKQNHAIKIEGSITKTETGILKDIFKDSSRIVVADTKYFSAGDYIKITEDDAALIISDWAKGYTGQIVKIEKIDGANIYLSSPLRRDFHISNGVKIVKLNMAQNVGIENIKIERQDKTTEQTSNIIFKYAANCYVKCVESINCNFSHIELNSSTNLEVSGNYLHDAFDYGNGGKGYGVLVHLTTGECLIKDNIFNNLRHSMLLQAGANGNVLAYNYSINPKWTGVMLPANAAGDLVLHGNYPYENLFESNIIQNIVIDNSHDKNGPGNTFFRNRAELYGIVMNNNAGDGQIFIGNEITNNGFLLGNYSLTGKDNYEFANNKTGNQVPNGNKDLQDNSLFLTAAPAYYANTSAWPPIGYPNKINSHNIQALELYKKGIFTPCAMKPEAKDTSIIKDTTIIKDTAVIINDSLPITDTTSSIYDSSAASIRQSVLNKAIIDVYPNPVQQTLNVSLSAESIVAIREINVISCTGKQALNSKTNNTLQVGNLSPGMYFVRIKLSNNSLVVRKILKVN